MPSSSRTTLTGVPALSSGTSATEIKQGAKSPTLVDTARVLGKFEKETAKDVACWTVEEVASWLEETGFTQDICEKFTSACFDFLKNIQHLCMRQTENEIDGGVLLRLRIEDVKSEIGITAFGVQDRIM